jgi:acetyl esterase/lipase
MRRTAACLVGFTALLATAAWAAEGVKIEPDVVYGHKDGLALTFDVFAPQQGANGAGVLFMVSGGWYSRWIPPEQAVKGFQPLLNKGFTVFAVRHGSSPKYQVPDAIEDVRRAVRFIRLNAEKLGVDAERLGVYGGSAGGHLSLMLGTASDAGDPKSKDPVLRVSDRVAAVVALFPPTDLGPWTRPGEYHHDRFPALGFDPKLARACSPRFHVTPDDPPTLLIHGDKDELVPIEHSQKILEEFKKQHVPCELIVIAGAAHGFKGNDAQRSSDAMVAWLEKYLAKK